MENNYNELDVARASDGNLYVLLDDYLKLKFEFEKLKVLLQEYYKNRSVKKNE